MGVIRNYWWCALALAATFVGCENAAPTTPATGTPATSSYPNPADGKAAAPKPADDKATPKPADAKPAEPEKKVDLEKVKLNDEQIAAIKKLETQEDQKIALEQKICPSSGDNLGEMGKPVKVVLKDQTVFLCCGSCVKDAKANPDAMLAKIGKK
jgi:type IV secretory pathway VirB10-like protein